MNKKKVALALAATLGIQGLAVTFGNIPGGLKIAYAQQSRLTNPEEATLATTKTLEAKVETVSQDSQGADVVTMSFPGLATSEIKDVTISGKGSTTGVSSTWDSKNGKLTVKGLKDGVNETTVTVNYVDTSKKSETYTLTLKKTATQEALSFKVTVGSGTIDIQDLKIGNTSVTTGTVELQKNGQVLGTQKITSNSKITFPGITGMKLNDVFDVVIKDENKKEVIRGQFVLTAQTAPTSSSFLTLGSAAVSSLETQLKNNFSSSASVVQEGDKLVVKDGTSTVAAFDQTVGTSNGSTIYGGIGLSTTSTASGVTINITPSTQLTDKYDKDNFIPTIRANGVDDSGKADGTSLSSVVIGNYTVTFSGAGLNTSVSKDASAQLGSVAEGKSTTNSTVFLTATKSGVTAVGGSTGMMNDLNTQLGSSVTLGYDKLEQGYQSVSADFSVKDNGLGGKTLSTWEADMKSTASSLTSGTVKTSFVLSSGPSSVKTSVVLEVDKLDGQVVTGTFKKTGEKSGQLTVSGTGLFKDAINNLSAIVPYVNIDGASKIVYSGTGNADSVTFDVEFNGGVPGEVKWSLGKTNKISNTVKTTAYEPVNASVKVVNNSNSATGVYLDVVFSGLNIPDGSSVTLESGSKTIRTGSVTNNKAQISVDQFDADIKTGDYTLKVTTPGNNPETYNVTVKVVKNDIGITIKATSASNTGVTVEIDAFLNKKDPSTIQNGRIEYREVGSNGAWSKIDLSKDDFKEDKITKSISGLTSGKEYEVRVVYNYKADANTTAVDVYSNTEKIKVSNSSSGNGNGTITGDGGSTTTGSSTGSTTISATDKNVTYGNGSASVTLPNNFKYDSGKTPVSAGVKYKNKDGKIITETKEQYSGITARFENGKIVLDGLVPGKEYTELSVDYTDNNGKTKTVVLKNIKAPNGTDSQNYLANIYKIVFNREADETGYNFHLKNLGDKKVSLREFVKNMLTEKEFVEYYKTPETKIEALYKAIVDRDSDTAGRDFWVGEYNKLLKVYGSESATLQAIVDKMVNENELKELADKLGVAW